jgi:NAD(P)-dependent dehydrogenase (short-subunit alcohol dehydrogenase family)
MADAVATQTRNLPLLATRATSAGKTYIITGANTGLGFETAKHLALLGAAKVILAVRNPVTTGQAAKFEIDEAIGNKTDVVEVWPLDLCSYASVRAFVKRATEELERIDGLILNAAVVLAKREVAEGHAVPVTVNVMSTFLMAVLLLPVMSAMSKRVEGMVPRIVVVTSRVGFDVKEQWEGMKDDPIKGMDREDIVAVNTWVLPSGLCLCVGLS